MGSIISRATPVAPTQRKTGQRKTPHVPRRTATAVPRAAPCENTDSGYMNDYLVDCAKVLQVYLVCYIE